MGSPCIAGGHWLLCSGCRAGAAGLWGACEMGCFCFPGDWILLLFQEVTSDWVALPLTLLFTLKVAFSWKPPVITSYTLLYFKLLCHDSTSFFRGQAGALVDFICMLEWWARSRYHSLPPGPVPRPCPHPWFHFHLSIPILRSCPHLHPYLHSIPTLPFILQPYP